ncbi:hypothetical protein HQ576_20185 [bacterium]|nr:hypothetical protein [bacterium]
MTDGHQVAFSEVLRIFPNCALVRAKDKVHYIADSAIAMVTVAKRDFDRLPKKLQGRARS